MTVFVVNPRAGRGRGADIARALPDLLARHGMDGRVVTTKGPKDGTRLAREAAREVDLVVAVGGDGTANEVVNGLAETDAAFGLVPVGSGNDLALALGVPTDLEGALRVLREGTESRLDLGRYDDGWFANSLGIGFEAQVTIESLRVTRLRGFAVYLWAALKALGKLRCADFVISADGERIEGRQLLLCVGNGPRVGGGFLLTPDARPFDGIFDLCLADAMGRWSVLKLLPKSLSGAHVSHPSVRMLRARRLEIESSEGFPFHVDGEVVDTNRKKLTVEIVPAKLRVRHSRAQGDDHG